MENRALRNRNVEVEIRPQPYGRRVPTGNPRGRPALTYEQKTSRKSRLNDIKETCNVLQNVPRDQAKEAILKFLRDNEMASEERVIKKVLNGSWNPVEVTNRMKQKCPPPKKLEPTDGLQMLLDCSLSKYHYRQISSHVNECGMKIMPSYYSVANAKKDCRPSQGIYITETCAEVELQSLLDCTIKRITQMISEHVDPTFEEKNLSTKACKFICSYGMDSSTGQRLYHQKFLDEQDKNSEARPDNSLIFVSMIPLKLVTDDGWIMWENPSPCSTRLVRPIKLQMAKETEELVHEINLDLEEEIRSLQEIRSTTSAGNLIISKPILYMTLIDGKVMNYLTGTSSHRCPVCGAGRLDFNDLENIDTDVFQALHNGLDFGICPLHCFINFMVHCLRLSYRMTIQVWRVTEEADKAIYHERKLEIQHALQQEIGIRVDYPNHNGTGNSNNGNCARRAFENPRRFAEILGIDPKFVYGLKVVLSAISSRYRIKPDVFQSYCKRLMRRYVRRYDWYPLSPTLHKVLIHGHEIARNLPLPLGFLSEQGAESKHRVHKKIRTDHARKTSRLDNLSDVFLRSMDLSDPIISSRAIEKASGFQHFYELLPETRDLLYLNDNENQADNDDDDDDDDDEETGNVDLQNTLDNMVIENNEDEEEELEQ